MRPRVALLLALTLAGCTRGYTPTPASAPGPAPQAPTPEFPGGLAWLPPEGDVQVDPLQGIRVRRLTSDAADDDIFYQEPRSFGGASGDLLLIRSARGDGQYRLHLVNVTTGAIALLREDVGFGWSPTWTRDGREVLVGHARTLLFLDALTGATRSVPLPTEAWITFPHVSPNGTRVLFVEETLRKGETEHLALGLARLDGSGYERVYTLDHARESFLDHPVWLDEERIAFLTRGKGRDFHGEFNKPYVLDLATRELTRLPYECSHYDPNPLTPALLCGQEGYVLDVSGRKVFSYEGIHGHATWAPDGKRFLATADPVPVPEGRPHHGTIVLLRSESDAREDMVLHGSAYDSIGHDQPDAQWSPDGRWIAWSARGDVWLADAPADRP